MQDFSKKPFTFDPVRAAELLSLMASPVRIEILRRIMAREWDVTALATDLAMTQSALSQHLAKLRGGKLVTTRRAGQQIMYSSSSKDVRAIFATLDALGPIAAGNNSKAC